MTQYGTLFVVATPIGNLEDMTYRAVRTLKESHIIAVEDTRVTAKLLRHFDIATPTKSIRGESGARNVENLISRLISGDTVALVTDAGTPSVSDPGYELVSRAHNEGISVSPIPGPSALAAAISVVGLRGEGVRFFGFLPRSGRRRKEMLAALRTEQALCILYESPRRLVSTLADLSEACGADRQGAVLRELTKMFEEIRQGSLQSLINHYSGTEVKGEIIVALAGNLLDAGGELTDEQLEQLITDELAAGRTVKDISQSISKGFGLSRKIVYQLALTIHQQGQK